MSLAEISITTVTDQSVEPPFQRILVPVDGSALSDEAVDQAVRLAATTGATLVFLTVVEPFLALTVSSEMLETTKAEYERAAERRAGNILLAAAAKADEARVPRAILRAQSGAPHEAIIETATERCCDLIAMASHGRKGFSALVLGSVTNRVLTHSAIPVLVLRKPPETVERIETPAARGDAMCAGAGIA